MNQAAKVVKGLGSHITLILRYESENETKRKEKGLMDFSTIQVKIVIFS
jgi:hypothetical protein